MGKKSHPKTPEKGKKKSSGDKKHKKHGKNAHKKDGKTKESKGKSSHKADKKEAKRRKSINGHTKIPIPPAHEKDGWPMSQPEKITFVPPPNPTLIPSPTVKKITPDPGDSGGRMSLQTKITPDPGDSGGRMPLQKKITPDPGDSGGRMSLQKKITPDPGDSGGRDVNKDLKTPAPLKVETVKKIEEKEEPKSEAADDKTEKEKKKSIRQDKGKSKVSKILDKKWSQVEEDFKKDLGKLPASASRIIFDKNLSLNRFEDVVLADQTRVVLSDPSLYIHASWVNISKKEDKKAIVSQLPLPQSSLAFWSMIAENNVQGILLLLDENEAYSFDAHTIFPRNKESLIVAPSTTVTHTHRVSIDAQWSLHVYLLCHGDYRKFVHVNMLDGWPGDGVPRVEVIWQIQSVFRKYSHPHVYMSLAGIGRASTFAAIQMAHERLHEDCYSIASPCDCVTSIREQRMHSIQSLQHAATVHAVMVQHIVDCPKYEKTSVERSHTFMSQYNKNCHIVQ